jgi:hypothetical protein
VNSHDRQYWLWVTRPDYYLDDDGCDRRDLTPSDEDEGEGWWTCHRETRRGDLVFLWRTSPKKDIGYLIQARSDAYSLANDPDAQQGWDYGCEYRVLYKFAHPVTIQDIKDHAQLRDWPPYRGRFQRIAFRISPEYWQMLNQVAVAKNRGYRKVIEELQQEPFAPSILREVQLEEALIQNLGLLRKFGYDLELYADPGTGATGRQFTCGGIKGRIDLLCYERRKKCYVVIELKNVQATQHTFGQISSYVGSVQNTIAGKTPVIGLVISRGHDARFAASLVVTDRITQLDMAKLGFD